MKAYDLTVHIPLFKVDVDFIFAPFKELKDRLKKGYKIVINQETIEKAGGLCFDLLKSPYSRGVVVIAIDDFNKLYHKKFSEAIGYLAHESVHAANAIISSRELVIESEASALKNDEIQAYIVAYLVEQALLKTSKAKVKKPEPEAQNKKEKEQKHKKSLKKSKK